ncbi:diacylglycerol/lipid kinase family protein [Butyrivibrio sp. TB]|uniref:diacylglycerol/lipid kinase family protein n=1 Tax=Butyrivibrio sp. TB TaxID=1520809 RepID=UPI0008CDCFA9|nr:YegS/Rv2252/BmrU family lipid kinase [Butyrivibrio sp. TB]SEQ48422.1 lipid kinase, YegS/Rv2252/BmrU family [Butyrivibrio sp. TB]
MYYVIVNPGSGSGRGYYTWKKLEESFIVAGLKYKAASTKKAGDAKRLTTSLMEMHSEESPLKLIVIGGDGTMNEVINGITDFDKVVLGYIPGGSAGDLAFGLGINIDTSELIQRITEGKVLRTSDIGQITYNNISSTYSRLHDDEVKTTRYFDVSAGIGFDAAVCEEALSSRLKKVLNAINLGKLTYLLIALHQIFSIEKNAMDITTKEGEKLHFDKAIFAAMMIHPFEGGGFMFGPYADCNDGCFDVCAAGDMSFFTIMRALPSAKKGKQFKYKGIHALKSSEIHIQTQKPLWVHTDGEVSVKSDDILIKNTGFKLKLMV